MNKERQRVKIAVACGWRWREIGDTIEWIAPKRYSPPDYPNDLNAMHEAEKVLTSPQLEQFGRYLTKLVTGIFQMHHAHYDTARISHATASQRAEAFLKTIKKWE